MIQLCMFLSFFPRIITQNTCITWDKMTSIGEDIDQVCDNSGEMFLFVHIKKQTYVLSIEA